LKELIDNLNGPIIIALSKEDLASPARLFKDFGKDYEQLRTVGLSINGAAYPASDLERIAKLPTKDEAYSMLMGLMKAPIEKTVRLLNELPTKFVRLSNAMKDKQEEVS
jgi:large subunit ribosomal protein L10